MKKNRCAPLVCLSSCCVHLCRSGCTWSARRSVLCSSLSTEHRGKGAYFTCASCSVTPPGNWTSTAPRRRTKRTHCLRWLFSPLSGGRSRFYVFNWQSASVAAGVKHGWCWRQDLKGWSGLFLRTVVSKCRYFMTPELSDLFIDMKLKNDKESIFKRHLKGKHDGPTLFWTIFYHETKKSLENPADYRHNILCYVSMNECEPCMFCASVIRGSKHSKNEKKRN